MYTEEIISTSIGAMSLIAAGGTRPVPWGNYFWLREGGKVINFWAENLQEADARFNLDGKVKVRTYIGKDGKKYTVIDDDRIPRNWYYNQLYQAGALLLEDIKDLYEYFGDPDNEIEQYIDPVSYHDKRGYIYKEVEKEGYVYHILSPKEPYKFSSTTEAKLGYKGKELPAVGLVYAPFIPNFQVVNHE